MFRLPCIFHSPHLFWFELSGLIAISRNLFLMKKIFFPNFEIHLRLLTKVLLATSECKRRIPVAHVPYCNKSFSLYLAQPCQLNNSVTHYISWNRLFEYWIAFIMQLSWRGKNWKFFLKMPILCDLPWNGSLARPMCILPFINRLFSEFQRLYQS